MPYDKNITYKIARVGLHFFEEPCLSGTKGSGTIFFSGCNLGCLFCQNHEISHEGKGLNVSEEQLVGCMLYLRSLGAHNINLVTPSLYAAKLAHTLAIARPIVDLPIVWNSSGYETVANLKKLEGLVDVYLPDFKYADDDLAWQYSRAKGYLGVAREAIREMRRQQPVDVFDENGLMQKGVIVRHLVLPSANANTALVMREIADIDANLFVSVMGQYFPTPAVQNHDTLCRRLTKDEYECAVNAFFDAGLSNGFCQELESATEEYVPSFDLSALKKIIDDTQSC